MEVHVKSQSFSLKISNDEYAEWIAHIFFVSLEPVKSQLQRTIQSWGQKKKEKQKKKHAANSFYLSPSHSVLSLACMWLTGIVNTVYMSRREWHKRLERRFKLFKRRKLPLFLSPTFRFKLLWASLFSRSIHIRTVQNKKNQRMCSFPCWRPSWQPACIILTNVF